MGLLSHDEILNLFGTAVSADLVGSRAALLTGISRDVVGGLPMASNPRDQILLDLGGLNAAGTLADNSSPLILWLMNATGLAGSRTEAITLKATLDRCRGHVASDGLPAAHPSAIETVSETPAAAAFDAQSRRAPALSDRERLALEAASRGRPGLVDGLERLCGRVLSGVYRIDSLSNMGSQFAVFRGTHLVENAPVAIKLPLVDYTRPASFGRREIELARSAAKREWDSLLRHRRRVATLPWPHQLVCASNPLLDGRGPDPVWTQEQYLVQEWIDGSSFDEVRQQLFSSTPSGEQIMAVVLPLVTSLLAALSSLEPELFADVSPRNFLWCKATKTTRLVDAGSLVDPGTPLWVPERMERGASSRITTAVTLPYLSADDIAAYRRGEQRSVQPAGVVFAIGKMFHEFVTNLHPLEGQNPALDAEPYASLPWQLRGVIEHLLTGTSGSMGAAMAAVIHAAGIKQR